MTDHLKADPEGWTSSGAPNCWFMRRQTPADRKVGVLEEQNRRLLEALSLVNDRLRALEEERHNDRS